MSRRSLVAVVLTAVAAAHPTDALASPQWLAPFDLSAAGGAALEQKAVFDGQDEALAIWRRREGTTGDFIVQVAIRAPGGPVAVQDVSAKGESAYAPDLAVNASGDAVAVWERSDGANYRMSRHSPCQTQLRFGADAAAPARPRTTRRSRSSSGRGDSGVGSHEWRAADRIHGAGRDPAARRRVRFRKEPVRAGQRRCRLPTSVNTAGSAWASVERQGRQDAEGHDGGSPCRVRRSAPRSP